MQYGMAQVVLLSMSVVEFATGKNCVGPEMGLMSDLLHSLAMIRVDC